MSTFRSKIVRSKIEQWKCRVPIDEATIKKAELLMGFRLPEQLRELYQRCGNGYFAGIRPLILPRDLNGLPLNPFTERASESDSVVFFELAQQAVNKTPPDFDFIPWPPHLLHFYEWGCGLESCVDRLDPNLRIVRFDPYFEDYSPTPAELSNGLVPAFTENTVAAKYNYCFQLESTSLEEWLEVRFEGHSACTLQDMGPQRARWHGQVVA